MAQIRYRANLSAKDFVFSAQGWGRSVIMKQYDQNFSRQIVSPTDPDKDIGIPQIFYAHNVMPCAQGFQSVGFLQSVANTGVVGTPYQVLLWQQVNGSAGQILITVTALNTSTITFNIYGNTVNGAWTLLQTVSIAQQFNGLPFTSALINGVTYIYTPFTECHTYDGTTWASVTLTGLTLGNIQGITYSFGYMIAYGPSSIAWSSTLSPTDFTPSLITGAGGGAVQGLKGSVVACFHHTFGFIVFSPINAVAAVYSGNARFPFNFREIIGCGGISGFGKLADLDAETGNLFAYTSAGLQIVSVTQAQVVHPEIANYLDGTRFEDFNDGTLAFSYTDLTVGRIYKKVSVISNRYLVISYSANSVLSFGQRQYTHALVYDISMRRWGKIKFNHIQTTDVPIINASGLPENNARAAFGLLDPTGNIYTVDFSEVATTGGTIILGKYQHSRDRLITLQQVDVEYVQSTANLSLNVLTSLDGKTFLPPVLVPAKANTNAPQYPCRLTGMNHSLCFQGVFKFDSLMLTYSASGRR